MPKDNPSYDLTRQRLLVFSMSPAETLASLLLNDAVVIVAFQNEASHGHTDICAESMASANEIRVKASSSPE